MRANLIVIFQVRQQYVTKMPLSEHNNVVKAFPSDRIDQPFGASILPRGAWRRWSVANAHRSKSSDENFAIGPIAIAVQIVGSPFPAESFRNLICSESPNIEAITKTCVLFGSSAPKSLVL